ncbi:MAG: hypothetical protein DHS20C07_19210 [Methyloligella sp.]|nr:MAG: hypothetical protein DHS20C07_19210 [Methyloligella sp.]
MPPKKSTTGKTQQLTLRIDNKTRFQLDFCSRISGMSITTFVERAIQEKAADIDINQEYEGDGGGELTRDCNLNWFHFWDPDEGVRTIKMFKTPGMSKYMNYEEDMLINFIREFWEYFAKDLKLNNLKREEINALWPEIPSLMEDWEANRNNTYPIKKRMESILKEFDLWIPF